MYHGTETFFTSTLVIDLLISQTVPISEILSRKEIIEVLNSITDKVTREQKFQVMYWIAICHQILDENNLAIEILEKASFRTN